MEDFAQINRQAWNAWTKVNKNTPFYDVEGFKKGRNMLNAVEMEALGDVRGKKLLHLQCHFGQDTLCWQRLGADCTGVDLSDEAIALAQKLNTELGLSANFVNCNLYDLPEHLQGEFDIVFTSYGTIGWLPDLDKWAKVVAHFLKKGGTFLIVDFHPVIWMLDEKFEQLKYSYFNDTLFDETWDGTYADRSAPVRERSLSWNHPLSEIINALIKSGLSIQKLDEFDYSNYPCFANMVQATEAGKWYIKGFEQKMPIMYAIQATK
jgi:ubiquinone/menaquinone biosynthesis C-methylase UbiE